MEGCVLSERMVLGFSNSSPQGTLLLPCHTMDEHKGFAVNKHTQLQLSLNPSITTTTPFRAHLSPVIIHKHPSRLDIAMRLAKRYVSDMTKTTSTQAPNVDLSSVHTTCHEANDAIFTTGSSAQNVAENVAVEDPPQSLSSSKHLAVNHPSSKHLSCSVHTSGNILLPTNQHFVASDRPVAAMEARRRRKEQTVRKSHSVHSLKQQVHALQDQVEAQSTSAVLAPALAATHRAASQTLSEFNDGYIPPELAVLLLQLNALSSRVMGQQQQLKEMRAHKKVASEQNDKKIRLSDKKTNKTLVHHLRRSNPAPLQSKHSKPKSITKEQNLRVSKGKRCASVEETCRPASISAHSKKPSFILQDHVDKSLTSPIQPSPSRHHKATSTTPQTTEPPSTTPQTTEPPSTTAQTTEPPSTTAQTTEPPSTTPQTTELPSTTAQTTEPPSTTPQTHKEQGSEVTSTDTESALLTRLEELEAEADMIRDKWQTMAFDEPSALSLPVQSRNGDSLIAPSLTTESMAKVCKYSDEYSKHLQLTGTCTQGGFNPWELAERIADNLFLEVVDNVASELDAVCSSCIDSLYTGEFMPPSKTTH